MPTGAGAEAAAQDLVQALETSNVAAAEVLLLRADLRHLDETGWTPFHWAVHCAGSAIQSSSAGGLANSSASDEARTLDDCAPTLGDAVGDVVATAPVGCACCEPAPAAPDLRAFLWRVLETAAAAGLVDVRSADGATLLMFAAEAGDVDVCDWLLSAGADPASRDGDGDVAAAWASSKGHHELARRLEQAVR